MACDVRYRTESALVIWILWRFMTQSGTKTEIDPQSPGEVRGIQLHDGSHIKLVNLDENYDPTDKMEALRLLQQTEHTAEFITGLIYFDPTRESLAEASDLPDTPLALLPDEMIRPPKESLDDLMAKLM